MRVATRGGQVCIAPSAITHVVGVCLQILYTSFIVGRYIFDMLQGMGGEEQIDRVIPERQSAVHVRDNVNPEKQMPVCANEPAGLPRSTTQANFHHHTQFKASRDATPRLLASTAATRWAWASLV